MLSAGYLGLNERLLVKICRRNDYVTKGWRDRIRDGLTDIIRLYRSFNRLEQATKMEAELYRRLQAWGRDLRTVAEAANAFVPCS